jgi:RNA-binding protein YhbY
MTELDEEVKSQVKAALDRGDIDQIHSILDALEELDHPELVKVEFTRTQLKDLEFVRQNLKQPNIATVLRLMVDGFMPGYKKAHHEANKARA